MPTQEQIAAHIESSFDFRYDEATIREKDGQVPLSHGLAVIFASVTGLVSLLVYLV